MAHTRLPGLAATRKDLSRACILWLESLLAALALTATRLSYPYHLHCPTYTTSIFRLLSPHRRWRGKVPKASYGDWIRNLRRLRRMSNDEKCDSMLQVSGHSDSVYAL